MKSYQFLFKSIPFFSVLFLLLVGSHISLGGYPLLPAFFLIPIYYWLVFRPEWLPLWSLGVIGLFYDGLMGYELGFSSLLLILSAFIGQYVRPFLTSYYFPLIWGVFGLYSLIYLALYGIIMSGGITLFISWVYAIIFYPLIAWGLSHLYWRLQSYG